MLNLSSKHNVKVIPLNWLFLGWILMVLIASFLAFWTEKLFLLGLPFGLIICYYAIVNFKAIWYLLLFSLPLSVEFYFSGGLATDLPTEPLMWLLLPVFLIYLIRNPQKFQLSYVLHPISLLFFAHFFWILIASICSVDMLLSIKFWLAKSWYMCCFLGLSYLLLRTEADLKRFFWLIYIPLSLVLIQTVIRHGLLGFTFEDSNEPMTPFFRNHVNYAAMITLFYPFIWMAKDWYKDGGLKSKLIQLGIIIYPIAIYLSYTRACMVALVLALLAYLLVQLRLLRFAVLASFFIAIGVVFYLANNNEYLDLAPDFEKTVHHDEFGDHLTATVSGQDASSMERVYRWVAAAHMVGKRPLVGFGPNNFHPYYKGYTVLSFYTYLSENEEKSTAHNYFITILVEQGFMGLFIFVLLSIVIFWKAEVLYHKLQSSMAKRAVMASILCLVVIYFNLLLSDLLEVDKVAPLFYISCHLIIFYGIKQNSSNQNVAKAG